MGSRSASKAVDAISALVADGSSKDTLSSMQLDVTDDYSISRAAKEVELNYGRLDTLVNNAGISSTSGSLREQYNANYDTNVTGVVAMTDAFLPLLLESEAPRVVYMSSGLGSLTLAADPQQPFYMLDAMAYRVTKAALDMVVVQQHKFLGPRGVKVYAVCPGFRATNLGGDKEGLVKAGAEDPEEGAKIAVEVVMGKRDEHVGRMIWEQGVRP
ncbi:MAG: hypothetical protein Q9222_002255, partial [Ikaeria aurantiellina]